MIIVGMRDKIDQSFQAVVMETKPEVAKRNFTYSINNAPELLFKAKDLELYKIAEFDNHDGNIVPCVPIELICRGDECVVQS